MKYCILDVICNKKISYLPTNMDLCPYSFEIAAAQLEIQEEFLLYVHPYLYGEALRILAGHLVLIGSDKHPKELIRILKNAEYYDWLLEKDNNILVCPGA